MIDSVRSLLDIFNSYYVEEAVGVVEIAEANPAGVGVARFTLPAPGLRIRSKEPGPLLWALKGARCADGAIVTFDEQGAHLHIVELKSKVTPKTWAHVKDQYLGMLLSARAVVHLLGVHQLASVKCYILMAEDAISSNPALSASPSILKTTVGGSVTLGSLEDWFDAVVSFSHTRAPLEKRTKGADMVGDFGQI